MADIKRNYFAYDFFTYGVEVSNLLPAGSSTQSFNIQADADFLLTKLAYEADIAGAAFTESSKPIPNVNVIIRDSGSGRELSNIAIPIPSLFGNGALPFVLPRQRIFVANSNVQVTFTNFDAAVTYNLRLAFIGEKAFFS